MSANREALGINAIGNFLQGFVGARKEKRAQESAQAQFEKTLAMKALELQDQKAQQAFQAFDNAQDYFAKIKTRSQASYGLGPDQKTMVNLPPIYDANEAKRLTDEYQQALTARYPQSFGPHTTVGPVTDEVDPTTPGASPAFSQGGAFNAGMTSAPPKLATLPGGVPQRPKLGSGSLPLPSAGPAPEPAVKMTGDGSGSAGGEKAMDEAFGKYYAGEVVGGGVTSGKNLGDLESLAKELDNGQIDTGGFLTSITPERAQKVTNKRVADARQRVQTVVFPTLRKIMGAQFTEEEGQRVISATFDDSQPGAVNAARARRLQDVLTRQLALRQQAIKYWEQHGTLKGYRLPFSLEGTSADEIIGALGTASPAASAQPTAARQKPSNMSDSEWNEYLTLEKKYGGQQ